MDTTRVIITVSLAMFFEFAIWGAWMPVLAGRLTGPLKMSGKQCAMIYATLTFASMITPFIGGYISDNFCSLPQRPQGTGNCLPLCCCTRPVMR